MRACRRRDTVLAVRERGVGLPPSNLHLGRQIQTLRASAGSNDSYLGSVEAKRLTITSRDPRKRAFPASFARHATVIVGVLLGDPSSDTASL